MANGDFGERYGIVIGRMLAAWQPASQGSRSERAAAAVALQDQFR